MKIGLLSDIHANVPALEVALEHFKASGCERIYHLGDLVGIGSMPMECIKLCRDAGVIQVMGNHDDLVASGLPLEPPEGMSDSEYQHQHWTHSRLDQEAREYIRSFPQELTEEIEGLKIRFVHFEWRQDGHSLMAMHPRMNDAELCALFNPRDHDLVLFGHVHRKIDKTIGGTRYHCEESLGCSPDSFSRFSIVEIRNGAFEIQSYILPYNDSDYLSLYHQLDIPAKEEINSYFLNGRISENIRLSERT